MDQQQPNPFAHRADPAQWLPWAAYWRRFPDLFPSQNASRHFIDTRKEKMQALGLLIESSRGFLVRKDTDQFLLHLLAGDTPNPLEAFSNDDLLAELQRRAAA